MLRTSCLSIPGLWLCWWELPGIGAIWRSTFCPSLLYRIVVPIPPYGSIAMFTNKIESETGCMSVNSRNDEAVITDDSEMEVINDQLETEGCAPVKQNVQVNCDYQDVTQLSYGNDDLLNREEPDESQMNLLTHRQRLNSSPEQMELVYFHNRHQHSPSLVGMRARESEYEDGSVIYEYDPDECGSVLSEGSYMGNHQKTLMDVLNYCQAMYDAIQKLDKKFDSLHRKVSDMQRTQIKPFLLKPRPVGFTYRSSSNLSTGKIRVQKPTERRLSHILPTGFGCHRQPTKVRLQRAHMLTSSPQTLQPESHAPVHRQSPPLPTIVSTHSLCPSFSMDSEMPGLPSKTNLATLVTESPAAVASWSMASPPVSSAVSAPPAVRNSTVATTKTSPGSTDIHNEPPPSSSASKSPVTASSCSLYPPVSTARKMPDLVSQASLAPEVMDIPTHVVPSAVPSQNVLLVMPPETSSQRNNIQASSGSASTSNEIPSSMNPNFEFIGDPKRNVKILGNYLMKALQKSEPKYAARYLVRALFPKEILLCSVMGVKARGRRMLDPNKIAAIREFLATYFSNYDLSERGRDWKACITNVNAMIRGLRCESKTKPEMTEAKEKLSDTLNTSDFATVTCNGKESEVPSQTSSTSSQLQNSARNDNTSEMLHTPSSSKLPALEAMASLGNPSRNVQLPFSVIDVAKGRPRPELSARYLIRHLFTEDVLVKSNVYGNVERGTYPLDCNKINALRDFLQENYPSFDLKETGYDWKACVAAVNSTIRSLRYDHKRALAGDQNNILAEPRPLSKSTQ
ncbi:BEN domain-containing protein 2 isoform X2 [Varanus komodoensis]|uniref:BEN domain-containing protein 2 isoform X2 n=1 Tax=Varanus komodoensis TaxID=61221 RepID=UPI001CF7A6E9|nr:BEN domain-containing protein 2 isoform X2 [Varanus komodoensis]